MSKLTLAMDFGGVIHSYTTPFSGPDVVSDPPTEGAIEFLKTAVESFKVYLLSARFHNESERSSAMKAVLDWFEKYGIDRDWFSVEPDRSGKIVLASIKPRAHVTIDDRAYRFEGIFPSVDDLLSMQPWNRRDRKPDAEPMVRMVSQRSGGGLQNIENIRVVSEIENAKKHSR